MLTFGIICAQRTLIHAGSMIDGQDKKMKNKQKCVRSHKLYELYEIRGNTHHSVRRKATGGLGVASGDEGGLGQRSCRRGRPSCLCCRYAAHNSWLGPCSLTCTRRAHAKVSEFVA